MLEERNYMNIANSKMHIVIIKCMVYTESYVEYWSGSVDERRKCRKSDRGGTRRRTNQSGRDRLAGGQQLAIASLITTD